MGAPTCTKEETRRRKFPIIMARQRSPLAPLFATTVVVALLWQLHSSVGGEQKTTFVPAAALASKADGVATRQLAEQAALGAVSALMASPLPALAQEAEGADGRVLAILALPLLAISWALFNVWRSAFR